MPNKREVAYNATHGRCAYCGCIINPMRFFLNQAKPGQQVAACPDCARFKGSDVWKHFAPACMTCRKFPSSPALLSNIRILSSTRRSLSRRAITTDSAKSAFILKIWTSKADTHTTTTARHTVCVPYGYICQNLVLVVVKIILNLILEEET